jgi:transposase
LCRGNCRDEPDAAALARPDRPSACRTRCKRREIAAAGASILYLPPYSPDRNPIEQLFAKLKALLRRAAARSKDQLWSAIGRRLDACPSAECSNYLRHCGYGSI